MQHHRQRLARRGIPATARQRSPSPRCSRHPAPCRRSRSTPATRTSQMRWDNTVRYNLGVRAQSQNTGHPRQPELRRRRPQLQQRLARHQPPRRAVRVRLRLPEEVRLPRRAAPRWYDNAYSSLDNTNNATANTLVNGLPVAGALSPYTKRYRQGRVGRMARRVRVRELRRGRRAGQRQGRPAHRVLGRQPAARRRRSTASRTRRTRSTWKGFATPGARRRSCSVRAAASRCRRSRRRICRSPGSGSTTGRRCAFPNRAAI